jgi:hypothetical protein
VVQLTVITMVLVVHCIQIVESAGWTLSSTVYSTILTGTFIESEQCSLQKHLEPSPYISFVAVMALTIGFGDLTGRLLTVFCSPLAVGATGHWLTLVAKLIIQNRQEKFRRKYVEGR